MTTASQRSVALLGLAFAFAACSASDDASSAGASATEGTGAGTSATSDGATGGTAGDSGVVDDEGSTGEPNPDFDPVPLPDCTPPANPLSPNATVHSVQSGAWSDPTTWNTGVVPAQGDDVQIQACQTVTYDVVGDAEIHTILINGKLAFSRTTDTRLDVGIIAVSNEASYAIHDAPCLGAHNMVADGPHAAALEVGTAQDPIPADVSATISLVAFDDQDPTCAPGIINAAARMEFHGAPMNRTWVKLGATSAVGSDQLTTAEAVAWRVGDRVIVTPNQHSTQGSPNASFLDGLDGPFTEERVITEVSGTQLTLDAPLTYEHIGAADADSLRTEVGNLSRNVVVESKEPDGVRGHTMYHHGSQGGISYAEFRGLGKAAALGRYPIHFHIIQDTMRGTSVIGASVWDSDNRWITIHGAEFLVVRDTVTYQALGHGVFFEDGSEVYNLVDNHLGVQALKTPPIDGQVLAYDANDGGCYWSANARNFVTNNTYVECDGGDSFIFDYAPNNEPMPVSTLMPDGSRETVNVNELSGGIVRGLEVHANHGWGPWIRGGNFPETQPLYFEDTRVWNVHYSIDIGGDNVVFDGVDLHDTSYGFYNNFPGPHVVRNAHMRRAGGFGTFMTYLGGHGTMLYEDVTLEDSNMGFRVTAKQQTGDNGLPIEVHARNFTFTDGNGGAFAGTEGDNARTDPLVMAVLHDLFGADQDAVVLPAAQNLANAGIPAGLTFEPGDTLPEVDGYSFQGYGPVLVAQGDVPWPDSPLTTLQDNLAPATVITSPRPDEMLRPTAGSLTVRGVVMDRFEVEQVLVNGIPATIEPNGMDWSVTFDDVPEGGIMLEAVATDAAGHEEQMAHAVRVWIVAE
ncbi:MAG: G8 domain-containing protein [Myxococcota bacterium]